MMARRLWFALMILASCSFDNALSTETQILHVDDVVAANDRERINLALAHAAELDGSKELRFSPRAYIVDLPQEDNPFAAVLGVSDVSNLTIDGQGAVLVMSNALAKTRGYVFKINRFKNLAVKNLTLTFRPALFIQGTIAAVDQPANHVSLSLDDEFNHLDALRRDAYAEFWCRVGLKKNPLHPKPATPSWMSVGVDENGTIARKIEADGSVTLQAGFIDPAKTINAAMNWETGDPMVVWLRSGLDGFYFEEGERLELENLSVEAVPHYAIKVRGVEQVSIKACEVAPMPGAMLSSSADGIDIQQSRNIRIQDCRLVATGDDAISLLNHGHGTNGEQHETKFPPPYPETNERALIRNNHIEGGNRNGILLLANDAEVIGNKILHTRQYGLKFTGDRTLIEANTFREIGTFAAYRHITDELNTGIIGSDEWVQRDAIIKNNLLEDWRNMPGILLKSVQGAVVTGNRFVMNNPDAIAIQPMNAYLTYLPAICVTHGQGGRSHSSDLFIEDNTFTPTTWHPDRPPIYHHLER
jgi:hypothetical protein